MPLKSGASLFMVLSSLHLGSSFPYFSLWLKPYYIRWISMSLILPRPSISFSISCSALSAESHPRSQLLCSIPCCPDNLSCLVFLLLEQDGCCLSCFCPGGRRFCRARPWRQNHQLSHIKGFLDDAKMLLPVQKLPPAVQGVFISQCSCKHLMSSGFSDLVTLIGVKWGLIVARICNSSFISLSILSWLFVLVSTSLKLLFMNFAHSSIRLLLFSFRRSSLYHLGIFFLSHI